MRTNYHRGRDREYSAVNQARRLELPARRFLVSGQGEPDKADLEIAGHRFQSKYKRDGFKTLYRELDMGVFGLVLRSYRREALAVIRFEDLLRLLKGRRNEDSGENPPA